MTATYDLIASNVLVSPSSSVTFSAISGSYRDLVVVMDYSTSTTSDMPGIRFNSDSGANYDTLIMLGSGSSAVSYYRTGRTSGWMEWYSAAGNQITRISIMDYSATDKHKTALFRRDQGNNVSSAGTIRWANTSAITSLTLIPGAELGSGNFNSGSSFYLYGIAG